MRGSRTITVSEQVGVHSVDEAVAAAHRLAEAHGIGVILRLEVGASSIFETDAGSSSSPFLWDIEVSGKAKELP